MNTKHFIYTALFTTVAIGSISHANDFCQTAESRLNTAYEQYIKNEYDDDTEVKNLVISTLNNPKSLACTWENLAGFNTQTSPDKRLFSVDWRVEGGGTMQIFSGALQYRLNNKVTTTLNETDRIMSIDQMTLGKQTVYFLTSWGAGYTSLHGQSLHLFTTKNNKPTPAKLIKTKQGLTNTIDFAYDPFSADDDTNVNELIKINPKRQEFSIPVIIENENFPNGQITHRTLRYRYNGKQFVYVKK
ncbi:MAG: hypothetical protein Q3971_00405 [Moraxella sp.]|nr:hypothetical protein [Moraxella sp.]